MMLMLIILILLATGIFAWTAGWINKNLPRIVSLSGLLLSAVLLAWAGITGLNAANVSNGEIWLVEYSRKWIPSLGISFHLAMDGFSFLLLALTHLLGILAVLVSWKEIDKRTGFFHFNLLFILAGIAGVFLALDLFLFYFFWELMLIPMYFIIAIWGHENRIGAAYKFFLFTQGSGLLMLLAILGLYFVNGNSTGVYSFDLADLANFSAPAGILFLFMLGFLVAFAVKLPLVPFHPWLPDAHTEAPTAGSLILAGLMLKTGAYGIIRFILPLFPSASLSFAPWAMGLGVLGILYGAKLAFAQTDLKRLVAYTSISHMGFVILGIYSLNSIAMRGVVMQIIAHALSTGALFVMAGMLQERLHTRDMDKMGGLWQDMPGMGGMGMVFVMASLGLPGLANFVAEFMILLGSYLSSPVAAVLASLGLIASAAYALRIMQRVFFGEKIMNARPAKLNMREILIFTLMVIPVFFLGIFPGPVFKVLNEPMNHMKIQKEEMEQMRYANEKAEEPDVNAPRINNLSKMWQKTAGKGADHEQ